jgi:hypothetical protein
LNDRCNEGCAGASKLEILLMPRIAGRPGTQEITEGEFDCDARGSVGSGVPLKFRFCD